MAIVRFYGPTFLDKKEKISTIGVTKELKYWEDVFEYEYIADDESGLAFKPVSYEVVEGELTLKPTKTEKTDKEKMIARAYNTSFFFGGLLLGTVFEFILMGG